jgi:3-methyl-2-oxobutanoate hydroxymethyltransferase
LKEKGEKIAVVTCYDYCFASALDELVDCVLVGDSMGMVVFGDESTRFVKIEETARAVKAVKRGAPNTFVIGDMPAGSFSTPAKALENAGLLKEAGADAVKLEGGSEKEIAVVKALVGEGIPVMGHVGLLPQTAEKFCVQGKNKEEAEKIFLQAKELEEAGCFSIVIECVPSSLAERIASCLKIPAIGIGAGMNCDGQVLVLQDLLGLFPRFTPKFVKKYADLSDVVKRIVSDYARDVKEKKFPEEKHCFK